MCVLLCDGVHFQGYFIDIIAAMAAYIHSLPKPSVRNDAFDIAFSLFERKKEFRDENVESDVPSSENWKSEDHINIYTSAKFLIDVLKNNPANSPFYTEVLPKGIRSNYFYITDTTKCPMSLMGHTLKRETQISCIVRSEKMLIQSIWMITSTFITLATQTHIRDRMYQSMT